MPGTSAPLRRHRSAPPIAASGDGANADVARVQSRVLDELRRRLRETIEQADGNSRFFHLQTILEHRKSQRTGNTQLLLVLGGSIGLDVRPIDVLFPCAGTLSEHMFHSATIVRLADGRVRMIDERWGVDSRPFVFTEQFARDGWKSGWRNMRSAVRGGRGGWMGHTHDENRGFRSIERMRWATRCHA